MADVWEKDLAQKSSLTTSDFIRVVGSDNVSYKQLVSNVADAIIARYLEIPQKAISSGDDLNSYTTVGTYKCDSGAIAASLSNCPVATVFNLQVSKGNNQNYTIQIITQTGTNPPTYYVRMLVTSTWGAWTKMPSRAEVLDKISYTTAFNVTQGTGDTYLYADRVGRTLFIEMVFRPASDVAQYTTIAHINNISNISRTHWSTVTHTGEPVRLVLNTNGTIQTENAIGANKWVATSCTALMNAI